VIVPTVKKYSKKQNISKKTYFLFGMKATDEKSRFVLQCTDKYPDQCWNFRIWIWIYGARNRVEIGLPYRPARPDRLAASIHWNQFLGFLKV
jgi:hypothetical protein